MKNGEKQQESLRGDVLTKEEIAQRKIKVIVTDRGGLELHSDTYADTIAQILMQRGFLEREHIDAACDYLELKNSVYGFLNAKTIAFLLHAGEANFKRSYAEMAYYAASKYLGRTNESVITRALNQPDNGSLDIIGVAQAYYKAFNSVLSAMEIALSTVKEEMKKGVA